MKRNKNRPARGAFFNSLWDVLAFEPVRWHPLRFTLRLLVVR